MAELNEKIENLEQVMTNKVAEPVAAMDHVMVDAYLQSEKVDKHLQEVADELNKKAEEVILDPPADNAEKMPKNMYTENKLKLEEDFSDFESGIKEAPKKDGRSHRQSTRDENDGNKFLDYDMFTFVHDLFAGQNCNTNPAPKTPMLDNVRIVNRKTKEVTYGSRLMRKFMDSGVDSQKAERAEADRGLPQVAVDGTTIIISAPEREDLTDVVKACEIYHITCGEPYAAKSSTSYWPWRIDVEVPCDRPDHPMMLDAWLEREGFEVEDVMYPDFAKGYRNALAKVEKRHQKDAEGAAKAAVAMEKKVDSISIDDLLNDQTFNDLFNKAIVTASGDDSPLKDHALQLVKDCQEAGLTFKRQDVIDLFMSEFDDTYTEE